MADQRNDAPIAADESNDKKQERKKIPGNFSYTNSPGSLKKVLSQIPTASKPDIFNRDFLGTVLGVTGGSANAIIPILKSTGFLNSDSVPTEIYAQFQTETGRASAALQALKNGYGEIFKRNQYAHLESDNNLKDIIVAITGQPKTEPVVTSIFGTFRTFSEYAKSISSEATSNINSATPPISDIPPPPNNNIKPNGVGLVYNINIVLPETTNIDVYNTIFKSLKANMLT